MTIPIKHFYMIRHGETISNAAQIMAGSMDTPLNETGIAQAQRAKEVVKHLTKKPALIYHSNLSRARDTANIINESLGAPLHEDKDWAEMHSGDWEGESYETTRQMFYDWVTPPNGESPQEFFARVKRAKIAALSQKTDPVLIVCHGGVMRAIGEIHGIPVPGRFRNAHLYEFVPKITQDGFPWTVYNYDLCEQKKTLIKNESDLFSGHA